MEITTAAEIAALLQIEQANNGAILSWSHWGDRKYSDCNGFTTALVLRALRHIPNSNIKLSYIRKHALDFLLKCEQPGHAGSSRFWPVSMQPDWIKQAPPADADRLSYVDTPSPPWLSPGVFLTWLWLDKGNANIVEVVSQIFRRLQPALICWQNYPAKAINCL